MVWAFFNGRTLLITFSRRQNQLKRVEKRGEYILDENGERIKGADGQYLFNAVKTTDWGAPETLEQWRANWAKAVNDVLGKKENGTAILNPSIRI